MARWEREGKKERGGKSERFLWEIVKKQHQNVEDKMDNKMHTIRTKEKKSNRAR